MNFPTVCEAMLGFPRACIQPFVHDINYASGANTKLDRGPKGANDP